MKKPQTERNASAEGKKCASAVRKHFYQSEESSNFQDSQYLHKTDSIKQMAQVEKDYKQIKKELLHVKSEVRESQYQNEALEAKKTQLQNDILALQNQLQREQE